MPSDKESHTYILMRHGETAWNRERRIMGDADVALSAAGREQCERAAAVLAGYDVARIVTSPLVRAAESAAVVAEALGLEVMEDAGLAEVRFGRWQGLTYEEVARDPHYADYARDPVATPTPGGETIGDVQSRGLGAVERAVTPATTGGATIFVSHGDIIRSLICHFLAVPLAHYRRVRIDNCGLTAVSRGAGGTEVKFVNMLADPERAFDPLHWGANA